MQCAKTAKTAILIAIWGAAAWASAQGAPSAEQMVEQLKKPATRSLRNLAVEAVSPSNASSASSASSAASAAAGNTAVTEAAPTSVAVAAQSGAAAKPVATGAEQSARPSLSLLIQFDFDSTRVKPESQQALANLAVALKSPELRASRFAVEGHTDAKGRADYNLRLSQQRAEAVRQLLTNQGVEAQRLQAAGKGATELANAAEPGAAKNRRVRIVNLD